jgi:hypothetical protein
MLFILFKCFTALTFYWTKKSTVIKTSLVECPNELYLAYGKFHPLHDISTIHTFLVSRLIGENHGGNSQWPLAF